MSFDKIKATLSRKFGPLPAWAWALVAGIGVYWYRQHTAGAAAATDSQATNAAADNTEGYYGPYGQSGSGEISGGSDTGGSGAGTSPNATPAAAAAPVINVVPPAAGTPAAAAAAKKKAKPKAQHKTKASKGTKVPFKTNKFAKKRSSAAVSNPRNKKGVTTKKVKSRSTAKKATSRVVAKQSPKQTAHTAGRKVTKR